MGFVELRGLFQMLLKPLLLIKFRLPTGASKTLPTAVVCGHGCVWTVVSDHLLSPSIGSARVIRRLDRMSCLRFLYNNVSGFPERPVIALKISIPQDILLHCLLPSPGECQEIILWSLEGLTAPHSYCIFHNLYKFYLSSSITLTDRLLA